MTGNDTAAASAPLPARRAARDVIWWWERRRLKYNLYVLIAGVLAFLVRELVLLISQHSPSVEFVRGGVSVVYSLVLYLVLVQLPANVWYTFGWILELLVRSIFGDRFPRFGPATYWTGLVFSVIFVVVLGGVFGI